MLAVLRECAATTKSERSPDAAAFHEMMEGLADFIATADTVMEKISRSGT